MADENLEPARAPVGTHYDCFIGGLGIPIEFEWGTAEGQDARGCKRPARRRPTSVIMQKTQSLLNYLIQAISNSRRIK